MKRRIKKTAFLCALLFLVNSLCYTNVLANDESIEQVGNVKINIGEKAENIITNETESLIKVDDQLEEELQEELEEEIIINPLQEEENEKEATQDIGNIEKVVETTKEVELYNTINDPYIMELGKEYMKSLTSSSDVHYYKVVLAKSGKLTIDFSHEYFDNSNTFWQLNLLDSNGNNMGLYMYSTGKDKNKSSWMGLNAGTYYIKVYDNSYSSQDYKIKASFTEGNYEREPNSNTNTATGISLNTEYEGWLYSSSDVDYYKVVLSKPGKLTIDFSHEYFDNSNTFWQLNLLDSNGNDMGLYMYSTGKDKNKNYWMGLNAGTYYIKVYDNSYSSQNYKIKASFTEGNYERESNNSIATSDTIDFQKLYEGYITDYYDVDYYGFEVDGEKAVNIRFENPQQNSGSNHWKITVVDVNSKEQFSMYSGTTIKMGKVVLPKGKYYIKVTAGYNRSTSNYKLGVYDTSDWMSHWGADIINKAMEQGLVSRSNNFRPDDAISRAEFVKVVNKAFGYTASTTIKYTDVPKNAWYYNEVAIAAKAGYISIANTKFRPNDPISREEAAVIVTSIMNKKDSNIDKLNNYKDKHRISSWALTSVEGAIEAGYMGSGSLNFRPLDNITRTEALATVYRVTGK